MDRTIDEEELQKRDGQEGRPAYVAVKGRVYDVSGSKLWRGGTHVRRHHAGQDLSLDITAAPHDESVLERVPLVGQLVAKEEEERPQTAPERLLDLYFGLHPHPVAVHFPVALVVVSAVFVLLHLLTGVVALEATAYYTLWAATVMTPLATASGYVSWWFNYGHILDNRFKAKIGQSATLFVVEVVALVLRATNPTALLNREALGWIYAALFVVMAFLVGGLGWIGARIVFPPKGHKK